MDEFEIDEKQKLAKQMADLHLEVIPNLQADLDAAREALGKIREAMNNQSLTTHQRWEAICAVMAYFDSSPAVKKTMNRFNAALSPASASAASAPNGVQLIAAERHRQMGIEGWTPEHDAQHTNGELAVAAACYALPYTAVNHTGLPILWPWAREWWKPKDRIRNLERAGALIAAEIDRLMRVEAPASASATSDKADQR